MSIEDFFFKQPDKTARLNGVLLLKLYSEEKGFRVHAPVKRLFAKLKILADELAVPSARHLFEHNRVLHLLRK